MNTKYVCWKTEKNYTRNVEPYGSFFFWGKLQLELQLNEIRLVALWSAQVRMLITFRRAMKMFLPPDIKYHYRKDRKIHKRAIPFSGLRFGCSCTARLSFGRHFSNQWKQKSIARLLLGKNFRVNAFDLWNSDTVRLKMALHILGCPSTWDFLTRRRV